MGNPGRAERWALAGAACGVGALYAWFFINAARRIGQETPIGPRTGDFVHFYYAARAMLEGTDIYTSGRNGYIYPPLLAFLYTPIGRLTENGAALVMLFVNLATGLATAWIAALAAVGRLGVPRRAVNIALVAALASFLALDKLKGEYQMWQTNALVMLMFATALWQLDRRPWLAGLALGLAFNIKYLPVLALPYLLVRRRWGAAAWFALGIVAFALLPAVLVGWETNLGYLRTAFAGFARLLGIDAGPGPKANIDGITAPYSVSVTSALARLLGEDRGYAHGGGSRAALGAAAALGLLYAAGLGAMYRARRVPALLWPPAAAQGAPPWRALVAVEWVGLIVAVLCFGPQTNMRHMSLLLVVLSPGVALLLFGAGLARRPLLIGTAALVLAIILPPGGAGFDAARDAWFRVGGPSVCMLCYFAALAWTGLAWASRQREASVA